MLQKFWSWYERNILIHRAIVAVLFLWQLSHLFWLTTEVAWGKLFGFSLFEPSETFRMILIIADYFEIPALLSGSLLYISSLRKKFNAKDVWFLFFINTQWLHLLWITDEFIIEAFGATSIAIPYALAWVAILIDYLELPVIFDTVKKTISEFLFRFGSSRKPTNNWN